MATKKVQLNTQVNATSRKRAKLCAVARGVSINQWVQEAIDAKAASEGVAQLEKTAAQLADYPPGRVATLEQMLKMAAIVAEQDTEDGLDTRYVPAARATSKRSPRRKRALTRRTRVSTHRHEPAPARAAAPRR